MIQNSFSNEIWAEGAMYTVGLNDGTNFKKMGFVRADVFGGKPLLIFQTEDKKQLEINPSYHSFTLEEDTEMNEVIYDQAVESGAWSDTTKKENPNG